MKKSFGLVLAIAALATSVGGCGKDNGSAVSTEAANSAAGRSGLLGTWAPLRTAELGTGLKMQMKFTFEANSMVINNTCIDPDGQSVTVTAKVPAEITQDTIKISQKVQEVVKQNEITCKAESYPGEAKYSVDGNYLTLTIDSNSEVLRRL